MQIALVVEKFQPAGGGVEAVAWQVAHGLARAGDEVRVFARIADQSVAGPAVEIVGSPAFWQPLRVAWFSRAVRRRLDRRRFDVVQTFSRTRHQDLYRAGGGSHADYMARQYGPIGAALRRLSPRHAVLLGIERAVFADPRQHVLCVSRRVRDEIARRHHVPADRLHVLHNGIDLARYAAADDIEMRRTLSAENDADDAVVWLLAGNAWQRKGLATALRAIATSRDARHRLWVAGADDPKAWRAEARRLGLADRVRFLGHRDDLERVLAAADGLLLPTRYDGFANVCVEAAACGRPIVTSGQSGSAEAVAAGCTIVDDPDDAAGFARAIDALAADAPARRAQGEAGRRLAESLSWDRYIDALRAIYRDLAPACAGAHVR